METQPCSCPLAGFCARHGFYKTAHLHQQCRSSEWHRAHWDGLHPGAVLTPCVHGDAKIVQTSSTEVNEANLKKAQAASMARGPGQARQAGPGTELHNLLLEFGLNPTPECPCKAREAMMNQWGVEGCRSKKQEIVGWLKEGWEKWGWRDKLKAAALAIKTGLAFHLNPLDLLGSLVDEAIRRAE